MQRLGTSRTGRVFGMLQGNIDVFERLDVIAERVVHVGQHQRSGVLARHITVLASVVVDGAGRLQPFGIAAVVVDDGDVGQRTVVVAPVAALGGEVHRLVEVVERLAVVDGVHHVEDPHRVEHHDALVAHARGVRSGGRVVEVAEHRVRIEQIVIGPADAAADAQARGGVARLPHGGIGGHGLGNQFRMASFGRERVEPAAKVVGRRSGIRLRPGAADQHKAERQRKDERKHRRNPADCTAVWILRCCRFNLAWVPILCSACGCGRGAAIRVSSRPECPGPCKSIRAPRCGR